MSERRSVTRDQKCFFTSKQHIYDIECEIYQTGQPYSYASVKSGLQTQTNKQYNALIDSLWAMEKTTGSTQKNCHRSDVKEA